jgi:3-isopropylmalate/(R)-2-methylmalate dehydratase small subunit
MEKVDIIEGPVASLLRNDIDTDQIIPKQFLKRVERSGFGRFLFYDWRQSNEIELEPAPILVSGRNFGCGSSREHAPWALEDFGFRAIIAPSFADIFYSNCTKIGLVPIVLEEEICTKIAAAGHCRIDLEAEQVRFSDTSTSFSIDQEVKHRLLHGLDDIEITLDQEERILAYEAKDPVIPKLEELPHG